MKSHTPPSFLCLAWSHVQMMAACHHHMLGSHLVSVLQPTSDFTSFACALQREQEARMEEEQRKHRAEMEALQARLQQAQGQRNRLLRAFEGFQGWPWFYHAHQGCRLATGKPSPHWWCHQQRLVHAFGRLQDSLPVSCL